MFRLPQWIALISAAGLRRLRPRRGPNPPRTLLQLEPLCERVLFSADLLPAANLAHLSPDASTPAASRTVNPVDADDDEALYLSAAPADLGTQGPPNALQQVSSPEAKVPGATGDSPDPSLPGGVLVREDVGEPRGEVLPPLQALDYRSDMGPVASNPGQYGGGAASLLDAARASSAGRPPTQAPQGSVPNEGAGGGVGPLLASVMDGSHRRRPGRRRRRNGRRAGGRSIGNGRS